MTPLDTDPAKKTPLIPKPLMRFVLSMFAIILFIALAAVVVDISVT